MSAKKPEAVMEDGAVYILRAGTPVYVKTADICAMTEDLIYTIRGSLMALPGRLAVDVAATATPAEASEVIRKEVYAVMGELSQYQYDPKKYEERVRERRKWETLHPSEE